MSNKYSRIIAGAMNWGVWGADLSTSEIAKLIEGCIDIGVTSFDHADIYGEHTTEKAWGDAWKNLNIDRENIQLISKCGIMRPSPQRPSIEKPHYDYSYQHIITSVETSLKNLNTDYLDMLLIHRPSPLMNPETIAKAIDHLKSSGKIRQFGVSNFTQNQVKLIQSQIPVEANQIEISPFYMDPFHDGTLDQCMTDNIIPMAWSPLGGGSMFKKISSPTLLAQRERLKAVADKYNWSLDEMTYYFILHHPAQIKVVTGSSKIERIKKAVDCYNGSITDAQWFEIWTAAKGEIVP